MVFGIGLLLDLFLDLGLPGVEAWVVLRNPSPMSLEQGKEIGLVGVAYDADAPWEWRPRARPRGSG
jgi:hypothetical protein